MSVLRSPLINPLRSPLYSPLLSSVAWWGNYNPSTGFAYDFKLNRYMSQGKSTGITQVVTEGRSTDAYVLGGGGNYVLRSANEPAQANGHGLDGFDAVTNIVLFAQDFTNAAWTKTATTITPAFADSPLGPMTASRCQFTSATQSQLETNIGTTLTNSLASILIKTNTGQMDTDITFFSSGTIANRTVTSTWQRLFYLNTSPTAGASNFRIAKRDVWGSAGTADLLIAGANLTDTSFLAPIIITTGTALTRDADDTRVVQGDDGGSPTIAPGFTANPNELTFRVDWDGVAVGTGVDRVLYQVKNSSNRFVSLVIDSSNDLRFGGDQTGSFQSLDAGGTFDDGGAHTAVGYFNRTTSLFKLSVDGGATISGTLTGAVPANLDDMAINRTATGTGNNLNGTDCRLQTSDGDFYEIFRDSSAGFF